MTLTKKVHYLFFLFFIFISVVALSSIFNHVIALSDDSSNTYTKAYFCSAITNGYGNGDCILLENRDANGNVLYGLIDSGRKIATQNNSSTIVKDFLTQHGVTKLAFVLITHSHGDHNGDAQTVLNHFK
jgi:beta-lactamase superfamily II metal-dependent hydrolase